jgi:outer membrane protein
MNTRSIAAAAALCLLAGGAVQAQLNVVKVGPIRYTTDSRTNGVSGPGIPPGADAQTGDATTLLFVYERMLTPSVGLEAVLGVPPRVKARATGTVAFLGDDILSAKFVAPTVFVNWHFGEPGATWRPYAGIGINYTKFVGIRSRLADEVEMGDSTGLALQAGVDYALNPQWGLWASVATLKVKSKLVATTPGTVLTTTIDFRPLTWQFGASYRF